MAGYVKVQAVPINDLSDRHELTNDNNMHFTTDNNQRGINHLICLGKGELKAQNSDPFVCRSEWRYLTEQQIFYRL